MRDNMYIRRVADKIRVECPISLSASVKVIAGARWNPKVIAWEFPLEYKTIKTLRKTFPAAIFHLSIRQYEEGVKRTQELFESYKEGKDMDLQTKLKDTLKDYQRLGVNFMTKTKRCINADDMGLGKTLQAIASCDELQAERILIVCPNTVKYTTWAQEIDKWLGEPVCVIDGTKKQRAKMIEDYTDGYLVVNYEAVGSLEAEFLKKDFDVIIFDEAHILSARNNIQTKTCSKISRKGDAIFMLTGTPIMNRPEEIWSLLNILYPKQFSSYWRFLDQHCEMKDVWVGNKTISKPDGVKDEDEFYEMLQPVLLRRLKTEVLDQLPQMEDKIVLQVQLYPEDRKVYQDLEDQMIAMIGDKAVATPNILSQQMAMRQVAISRDLLQMGENYELEEVSPSAKIDTLVDYIKENKTDHKMVVFTNFRGSVEVLKRRLNEEMIGYVEISGGLENIDRRKNIKRFQDEEEIKVVLATIQTAGTGTDGLQYAADTVIFLDKHWNAQVNNQARDRLYRTGQTKKVQVVEIIAEDTIEEHMESILQDKQEMFDTLIEGEKSQMKLMMEALDKFKEKVKGVR